MIAMALDYNAYICLPQMTMPPAETIQHIETETKYLRFYTRHFQMHFIEWIVWISEFVPEVLVDNIPTMVPIMAWRRPGRRQTIIWTNYLLSIYIDHKLFSETYEYNSHDYAWLSFNDILLNVRWIHPVKKWIAFYGEIP